ncbi:hypothetical protein CB1_000245009 [Camelus ferus]|nr:hypothetical protein CB1_000245009 [Camelus ferus]
MPACSSAEELEASGGLSSLTARLSFFILDPSKGKSRCAKAPPGPRHPSPLLKGLKPDGVPGFASARLPKDFSSEIATSVNS